MRKLFLALGFCLAACGNPSYDPASTPSITPISEPPISRCMNLGSALEASFEGEWGYIVRREDLVRLKQAGFDTVRLPVRWSVHAALTAPYAIDADILARVQEIADWAQDIGLNIVINVHHYDALNEDPDTHEPRLEAIWDQLAAHFAGAPDSLIFETLNEPHTNMTVRRTDALNKRLIERIRQDHPERWVILATAEWGNLWALEQANPDYDPKTMLTYHEYSPYDFTHQGASWTELTKTDLRWGTRDDVAEMMSELDKAAALQERLRMPVFVGEFGVYEGVPIEQRARWTRTLRSGLEARGLAWCYWDFAGSLKVYDMEQEAWLPELKAALLD